MLLSLENDNPEVLAVALGGDGTETLDSQGKRRGSGGVEEHGIRIRGSPGTWEALSSPRQNITGGGRLNKAQALGRGDRRPLGAKLAAADVVPRSEGNRASGKGGSGQSTFIVPLKQGNRPKGACGGKGGAGKTSAWLVQVDLWIVEGKDERHTEVGRRLNETSTDSETGEGFPRPAGT